MKFIKILPLLMVLALCGCGKESSSQSSPLAVSGLPPVAWIAQEIGGKYITSVSLLPEGRSPHDYAPGPSVLRRAAAAKLFFSCGMPFEKSAEKALRCEIVDVTKNIGRIMFDTSGNAHEHHGCSHTHADGTLTTETTEPEVTEPEITEPTEPEVKAISITGIREAMYRPNNNDWYYQQCIAYYVPRSVHMSYFCHPHCDTVNWMLSNPFFR